MAIQEPVDRIGRISRIVRTGQDVDTFFFAYNADGTVRQLLYHGYGPDWVRYFTQGSGVIVAYTKDLIYNDSAGDYSDSLMLDAAGRPYEWYRAEPMPRGYSFRARYHYSADGTREYEDAPDGTGSLSRTTYRWEKGDLVAAVLNRSPTSR